MPDMSERRSSTASVTAIALVAMLILLPVVYVASLGPVLLYDQTMNDGNTPRWIVIVYEPLDFVFEQSEAASDALNWYLKLWGVAN